MSPPSLSWQVLHGHGGKVGGTDWKGLLPEGGNSFHPQLRAEILKYGELAQATYDGFYGTDSANFGLNRFPVESLLKNCLPKNSKARDYTVVKYLWATSGVFNISADAILPSLRKMAETHFRGRKVQPNLAGFIAHSPVDDPEGIDIAIVWRGFIVSDKWVSNIGGAGLVDWDGPAYNTKGAKVHMGFLDIYKNSLLIDQLPPKQRKSTDPADKTREGEMTVGLPPVCCFAFAPPQPGNKEFKALLRELKVPALRVIKEKGGDLVPRVPNLFWTPVEAAVKGGKPETLAAALASLSDALRDLHNKDAYQPVEVALQLDSHLSKALKPLVLTPSNWKEYLGAPHNLELYLWLVATQYGGQEEPTGPDSALSASDRDWALLNKSDDLLKADFKIPPKWWAAPKHGGLVQSTEGRWRTPKA